MWHTAGVLADGLVAQQNAKKFRHVHGPKVTGTGYMHCAIRQNLCSCAYTFRLSLDLSEALDYAAANACLDSLALCQRAQGRRAVSVDWGPWAEAGMASGGAISSRMKAMGLGLIEPWQGIAALRSEGTWIAHVFGFESF